MRKPSKEEKKYMDKNRPKLKKNFVAYENGRRVQVEDIKFTSRLRKRIMGKALKEKGNMAIDKKPDIKRAVSSKKLKITAPVIASFCKLVNESKLLKQETGETKEAYCKRVCMNFELTFTDRVRARIIAMLLLPKRT